jgi:UDP-N-acetylglucosamine 1-carboxyvinyltransferase
MRAIINGGKKPHGIVRISGAKNSATRLLAAALLTDQTVVLENFPTRLEDVGHKIRFIRSLGGRVEIDHAAGRVTVDAAGYRCAETADYKCPIRTTYLLAAGQILRSGIARVPYPGGCRIGSRGYDLHMMVWRDLGCEVVEEQDYIEIRGKAFKGGEIRFPISTVGGTENALICAAVAQGMSEIVNAYITPEVDDLIDMLKRMGARIEVSGNSHIRVEGKSSLTGARMAVIPDRIEALTWIVYAIMSRGELLIENVPIPVMQSPLLYIGSAGVDLFMNSTSVYFHPDCIHEGRVRPFEVPCGTHPGVISDMQPFFTLLGLCATGVSRIFDYRYPERIDYVRELAKFCPPGALQAEPGKITINGPCSFKPSQAVSTDLRGGMALILAALGADGASVVEQAEMALRGYNDLAGKLAGVGIEIRIE